MDRPVKTFSIGFAENDYNELEDARIVARHFRTDHVEYVVEPNAIELLPRLVSGFDEPFADSSAIPTYYVSQLARQHVTVALSGDGGDELFAGYQRYLGNPQDAYFDWLPQVIRQQFLGRVAGRLPGGVPGKRYLQYLSKSKMERHLIWLSMSSSEQKIELYNSDFRNDLRNFDPLAIAGTILDGNGHRQLSDLEKAQYIDVRLYLPNDILAKVDITSMMNSLEVRVPLLDHEFVEFAMRIPSRLKLHNGITKYVFKKFAEQLLPSGLLTKRKHGFSVPLKHWFRKELKPLVADSLLSTNAGYTQFLCYRAVNKIVKQHWHENRDHSSLIWALLNLELWLQDNRNRSSKRARFQENQVAGVFIT